MYLVSLIQDWIDHGQILLFLIPSVFFLVDLYPLSHPLVTSVSVLFISIRPMDYFSYNVPIMEMIGGKGMEGMYFYAFAWLGWWFATFLMKKTSLRFYVAAGFLLFISSSATQIPVGTVRISGSSVYILIISLFVICKFPLWKEVYLIFCSGLVAMVFATMQLMDLYDPIWFVKGYIWICSSCVALLLIIAVRGYVEKLIVLSVGVMQGEAILVIVFRKLQFFTGIGELAALDIVMCTFVLISFSTVVGKSRFFLHPFKQKHVREGNGSL